MRICIFGAGAIGGHIAGHLATVDGVEVNVVARGEHLEAIRRKGLRIVSDSTDFTVRVNATDKPQELGIHDYVFITLKSHQVPAAVPAIRTLLGADTAIIPPTTGIPYWYFHGVPGRWAEHRLSRLDPGNVLWDGLGPERALGCAFWTGAEVIEPGVIRQDGASSGYPLGEPNGIRSERVTTLSRLMSQGGLRAPVRDAIRGDIWMKMINSLVWNQVAFLTTASNGEIATSPETVLLVRRMMGEMETLAHAFGVDIPVPMEKRINMTLGAAGHRMSMLQDLQRGRTIEIDALADSVTAMSELTGIAAPTVDALVALTKLRGRLAGVYVPQP
ncbi:MAG: 2-dehydropantoate 2-reductase [Gammaproteobacteria bacterium]|jgi:2-dehydropantoate 2-reductase